MLGHLRVYVGRFGGYLGFFERFWRCFGYKKLLFETLAERWLPEGVFHGPFGGFGGPMLGHLETYVGRFGGYLGFVKDFGSPLGLKSCFLKPLPKGGFRKGFFMGHLGAMVDPCLAI